MYKNKTKTQKALTTYVEGNQTIVYKDNDEYMIKLHMHLVHISTDK